jgi:gamma-glutamyltranspeptidase/glutathione hydrolase
MFAAAVRSEGDPIRGMVTSPHTLATQAGLNVLRDGGNAIEASIAVASSIAVTYPHFAGMGGDSIWIVADNDGRKTSVMGIGQAADNLADFGAEIPQRGSRSTLTSAGTVDAWSVAQEFSRNHWEGKKTLSSLLDEAIGHAENGFATTRSESFWHDYRKSEIPGWHGFLETFAPDRRRRLEGDVFVQPRLARSLKLLAAHGLRDFYEGELAARIAKGLQDAGSPLTLSDLRKTRARETPPISLEYRGLTLLAPPPPTQGVSTLAIMGILRECNLKSIPEGSADYYHLCIEAVKQAFLDRSGIADPDYASQDVGLRLSRAALAPKFAAIDMAHAMPWPPVFRTGDTVYFGAVDEKGRSASVLQSLYFDWGSGVVAGDTGIVWHNRGASFSVDPRSPNFLAAGKRPFSTLNPGIALKGGRPHAVYGTQGADGQPQTLAVVLTRLLDYGMDPLSALSGPRFLLGRTFSDSRDGLKLEEAAGAATFKELARRNHEVMLIAANSPLAGQAGAILIHDDGSMTGAHDPRSDGTALGL